MNSGGIGLLVTLLVRAQRQRQRVLAFGLSDHYRADLRADPPRRGGRHPRLGERRAGRGRRDLGRAMSDERTQAAARDATSWAKSVSRLNVSEVPEGAINLNVRGPAARVADPGLREDVAEDLPGAPARGARLARRPDRHLEGALPGLLARGQPLLRPAHRHRAGRRGAAQHGAAGQDEALDRRDGAVRRRGVVHADDPAGAHVRRLDHVQRDARRTARRWRRRRC